MRVGPIFLSLFVACVVSSCSPAPSTVDAGQTRGTHPMDDVLTLAHLQAKATHNSYHLAGDVDLLAWNYNHLDLDQQATQQGVRGFELDVHDNPDAGRLEVYHVDLVDYRSTCGTLNACLQVIAAFSNANPGHHPLLVQLEPKEVRSNTQEFFVAVEAELLAVFGRDRLLTPDDVQGANTSLGEAVSQRGWPTLGQTRGKLLFAWDNRDSVAAAYSNNGQSLQGRLMFVDSRPGETLAAFAVLNDPIPQATLIQQALAAGMLVRTRADSDGVEPAANDVTRRDAALASGAQFISTDYPGDTNLSGFSYTLQIPGGTPSRCNPVTAPLGCTPAAVEDPALLPR